jgi:hypothetical protein
MTIRTNDVVDASSSDVMSASQFMAQPFPSSQRRGGRDTKKDAAKPP